MTEKSMGSSISWFVGEVEDVYDPDQSGRVRVRVFGKHDDKANIKTEHLPWAIVKQDSTSAALGKVGKSPLGLLKGSKVFGHFADSDHQIPIVWGSFGKAGDPKPGSTADGKEQIDINKGSIPTAATNQSAPVAINPYSRLYDGRITINDVNLGKYTLDDVDRKTGIVNNTEVDKKLKKPTAPTTASVDKGDKGDILDLIHRVDPNAVSAVLPNMVSNFRQIRDIIQLTSINGLTNLVSSALSNALSNIAQSLGIDKVIGVFSNLLSTTALVGSQLTALRGAVTSVINEYVSNGTVVAKNILGNVVNGVLDAASMVTHVVGNSIEGAISSILSGLPNTQIAGSIMYNISSAAAAALESVISSAMNMAKDMGLKLVLGLGLSDILGSINKLIPDIAHGINNIVSGHIPEAVTNAAGMIDTMTQFAKNQALLKKKKDLMKSAFDNSDKESDDALKAACEKYAAKNLQGRPPGTTTTVSTTLSDGSTYTATKSI